MTDSTTLDQKTKKRGCPFGTASFNKSSFNFINKSKISQGIQTLISTQYTCEMD